MKLLLRRFLTRFLTRLDDQLSDSHDQHLAVVGVRSVSPDEPRRPFEVAGYWSHCSCCPPGCTDVHRDGCDLHQSDGVA